MNDFKEKVKVFFENVKGIVSNADSHARKHIILSFATAILSDMLGGGLIFNILFAAFIGLVYEVLYCFAPWKSVKVWKFELKLPDFEKFKDDAVKNGLVTRNSFNNENYVYNFIGIGFYMIIFLIKVII